MLRYKGSVLIILYLNEYFLLSISVNKNISSMPQRILSVFYIIQI